jgi:hypothetical protein
MNEISVIVTGAEVGSPWLADVAGLANALGEAEQRLAAY